MHACMMNQSTTGALAHWTHPHANILVDTYLPIVSILLFILIITEIINYRFYCVIIIIMNWYVSNYYYYYWFIFTIILNSRILCVYLQIGKCSLHTNTTHTHIGTGTATSPNCLRALPSSQPICVRCYSNLCVCCTKCFGFPIKHRMIKSITLLCTILRLIIIIIIIINWRHASKQKNNIKSLIITNW